MAKAITRDGKTVYPSRRNPYYQDQYGFAVPARWTECLACGFRAVVGAASVPALTVHNADCPNCRKVTLFTTFPQEYLDSETDY